MTVRSRSLRVAVFALAVAPACRTVGPDYQRPVVKLPDAIRGAATASTATSIGDTAWTEVFQDEQLRTLIRTALAQNDDVKIAAARVLQAEAVLGITRADAFPTVDGQLQGGGGRTSATDTSPARTAGAIRAGVSAGWEVDFWGKYRRATQGARAELLAASWGRRAVATALVGDVADGYYNLRSLDLQLEIARRTLTSRQESLELTRIRERGGATSLVDVREAEQLVFGAGAAIADLERRIAQQEHALSFLLGDLPGAIPRGLDLVAQPRPTDVPAGLPSALHARRPDVQAAEQAIVAANAQIGVARAAYFPTISLTGTGGVQSAALRALFTAGAGYWSLVAGAVQPIVTAGRTRSQVALAKARTEEATAAYAQTVKGAFRDVSDALVGLTGARALREQQEQLATAAQDARRLADIRYRGGAASYLEVLDADTRLFSAEIQLAQARQGELASVVELYRSLGGGWQPDASGPQATSTP
jgi:multidrug efflux system outer membrane protein